jgi:hypothetical protein
LPEPADLEPEISIRELPSRVAAARERSRREDQRLSALVEPRIAGHIATYGMAVDAVARLHQQIADRTDIDLSGDTRWAAMWLVSGRSIGFARAVIVLARSGIGDEALPTARALHESVRLLEAVSNGHDRQLVTRWLEDDDERHVRPREVRAANEAAETLVAEAMIAAGEQPLPSTRELSDKLYHRMSVVTHNRRQAIDLVVASNLRRMACGRHPSPVGRGQAVFTLGTIIEEAVRETGRCLSLFLGPEVSGEWLADTLRPTLASFEAVRADQPLEEAALCLA